MVHDVEYSSFLLYAILLSARAHTNPFDESILFSINWPGAVENLNAESLTDENSVVLTTTDKEKYKCILPEVHTGQDKGADDKEIKPDPMQLLSPLFKQTACSYRLDTYWTYELCHGTHLRQYHEEKEPGKKIKLQEYYLGYYNKPKENVQVLKGGEPSNQDEQTQDYEQAETEDSHEKKVPTHKVEGSELPYFQVTMTGGTPCDLINTKRLTHVKYVCHETGRGEIYEIKETITCEYDAVVFTKELCAHPDFREKKKPVNTIKCHPLEGAPQRPLSMELMELESQQGQYTGYKTADHTRSEVQYRERTRPAEPISKSTDERLLKDFLSGDYCITGGSSWWKHEFCYGKYVIQFHDEKHQRTTIYLGRWSREAHLAWLEKNPHKRPKPAADRKQILQFYSDGENCDLTGKPRTAEVKLRCIQNDKQPHSVAIYLMEPTSCEYTLVVESPILCSIVADADKNGLLP